MSYSRALSRLRPILLVTLAAALVAVATLASPAGAREGAPHNRADDVFSQKMPKHHLHGIAMSQLALARSADPAARSLAARIRAGQTTEVRIIRRLLSSSGAPLAGPPPAPIVALNQEQQLAELRARVGGEFDRAFLAFM